MWPSDWSSRLENTEMRFRRAASMGPQPTRTARARAVSLARRAGAPPVARGAGRLERVGGRRAERRRLEPEQRAQRAAGRAAAVVAQSRVASTDQPAPRMGRAERPHAQHAGGARRVLGEVLLVGEGLLGDEAPVEAGLAERV